MQVIDSMDEMSGSELLDHVDVLAATQRRVEVDILRAAVRHAIINNADTIDAARKHLKGAEKAKLFGGQGTPEMAEFAAAKFGARMGMSEYSAAKLIADGLDITLRLPLLWARVEAFEVKVSYARFVAQKTRHLTLEQAAYVDSRVAEAADGRVTWTRFELMVEGAIAAADPVGAAERERKAAEQQFANATRSNEHGIRGFYIRAMFPIIARLDATVAYLAEALRVMGDESSVDDRRVKAVLMLSNPMLATRFLEAYRAWKDRPADPDIPADEDDLPATSDACAAPADSETPKGSQTPAGQRGERSGEKPTVDWSKLLPTMVMFVHLYRGEDGTGVVRVEGEGPVTEAWVREFLGEQAKFRIRPVLDLAGQAPVDSYEIPDRHRQAVHLMTPADIFPFSSSLSRKKPIDHNVPFVHGAAARGAGQSRVGNYGPMTTFHHRIKTHGRWQVKQPFPGIYVWRDEHGAFFLVDHTGTRRTTPSTISDQPAGDSRPATQSRLEAYTADLLLAA